MLEDNEFWATVINSSANWVIAGAMVIQTVIFFITFKYGLRYIDQHKEKSKLDSDDRYAKLLIEALAKYHLIFRFILDKKPNLGDKKEAERINRDIAGFSGDKRKAYLNLRSILPVFRRNIMEREIISLSSKMMAYARIINDETLNDYITSVEFTADLILDEFRDLMQEAKPEMINELKRSESPFESQLALRVNELPNGIDDEKNEVVKLYISAYSSLSKYLDKYLISSK